MLLCYLMFIVQTRDSVVSQPVTFCLCHSFVLVQCWIWPFQSQMALDRSFIHILRMAYYCLRYYRHRVTILDSNRKRNGAIEPFPLLIWYCITLWIGSLTTFSWRQNSSINLLQYLYVIILLLYLIVITLFINWLYLIMLRVIKYWTELGDGIIILLLLDYLSIDCI